MSSSDEDQSLDISDFKNSDISTSSDVNPIPEKSKHLYAKAYLDFTSWQTGNKVENQFTETVLLDYFNYLGRRYAPSSMWHKYSMIRSVISVKHGIDISTYRKLLSFIRGRSEGFEPKRAEIFSDAALAKFMKEAADNDFLTMKVSTIFGVVGGCRVRELVDMKLNQVQEIAGMFLVKIPWTETSKARTFTIHEENANIVKKYMSHRLKIRGMDRFFLRMKNNRMVHQPIGHNVMSSYPSQIAEYLGLENPKSYTGQSFKRTSTLLAINGADMDTIMRHEGSKSPTANKVDVDQSLKRSTEAVASSLLEHPVSSKIPTSTTTSPEHLDNNVVQHAVTLKLPTSATVKPENLNNSFVQNPVSSELHTSTSAHQEHSNNTFVQNPVSSELHASTITNPKHLGDRTVQFPVTLKHPTSTTGNSENFNSFVQNPVSSKLPTSTITSPEHLSDHIVQRPATCQLPTSTTTNPENLNNPVQYESFSNVPTSAITNPGHLNVNPTVNFQNYILLPSNLRNSFVTPSTSLIFPTPIVTGIPMNSVKEKEKVVKSSSTQTTDSDDIFRVNVSNSDNSYLHSQAKIRTALSSLGHLFTFNNCNNVTINFQ